jgi:hypothetical protein
MDVFTGEKNVPLEVQNNDQGFFVICPEFKIPHAKLSEEGVDVFGSGDQVAGGWRCQYTLGENIMQTFTTTPSQYEFFMANPFPSSFTSAQIASAISDGVNGGCLWVIKQGGVIWFAVTPQRVIRDVRRTSSAVSTPELLASALRAERGFSQQPADRIQNIFPRLEVIDGKLVNTTIINGKHWEDSFGIKSAAGQSFTWSWIVGLFNDCATPDGPLSNTIGPSILDIGRCDWEFFGWNDVREFSLVETDDKPRIDRENKTVFYNPNKRCVFTLQLRGPSDKSEDYIGYTDQKTGFYSDTLSWFLKNTYNKG